MKRTETIMQDFLPDRRQLLKAGLGVALANAVGLASAHAQLKVTVSGGHFEPVTIAISPFAATGEAASLGQQVVDVIANNLQRSGYFNPIDPATFTDQPGVSKPPKFEAWRALKAQFLITGQATLQGDKLTVAFRLWNVDTGTETSKGIQFSAGVKDVRRLGHKISDAVYTAITNYGPYFDTRIVFVDESGTKNKRVKRLAIMDQDGANVRTLTSGTDLVLTPRFSPSSPDIAYMAFDKGSPRVYIMNIETGQREIVGDFPNMSFAPRFSPDGQSIVLSLEENGNSNIYAMDLRSRQQRKLTDTPAINTGPSFAPDGARIVFESDRGGTQQIYVMGSDGSNPQRISFGEGRYSTPVWSPDGKWIAFTKQKSGKFSIGVMKPDGSGERILTEGYHNEGPTWAPNGQVLMFFREGTGASGPKLYSVDVTGFNEQVQPTPSYGSDPAWSPLLN